MSFQNTSIATMTSEKSLLNDKIAKKIFKNEKYGKKLAALIISDLLKINYDTILNNITPIREELALSALTISNAADIVYKTDKFYFNFEINYASYSTKSKVLFTYVFQLSLEQLNNYKNYPNLKEVIQINIDAYDFYGNNEFIYKSYLMDEKTHQRVSDLLTIYHINLAHLRKVDYNSVISGSNKLMYDLYFLICDDDKLLDTIYGKDDFMCEIIHNAREIAGREKLNLFLSEEEIMKQDAEFYHNEGFEQGIKDGIKEGIEQGIEQTTKSVVKNLLKKKMSIDDIASIVELSTSEVEKIINNL